jgi:hypothetical protein
MSHDTDFYSWTQEQAALLQQGRFGDADIDHLIEELYSMGASEKRELESRLIVLLAHLLKWQYQPDHRSISWEVTIRRQRIDVRDHLLDNPGLKPTIPLVVNRAYPKSRLDATGETRLKLNTFPTECPWSLEQVLDDEFWPE